MYEDSFSLFAFIFGIGGFISLLFGVAVVAGLWKLFEKAGKPGWAAIIPFYNIMIWYEITGRPNWWIAMFIGGLILSMIPILNFVTGLAFLALWIIMSIDLAKSFGKDAAWGIGIALLGFVFLPMLGFGDAQYQGPQNVPMPGPTAQP